MKVEKGDNVVVNFGNAGVISGIVENISFSMGLVFYDIKIYPFLDEPENRHVYEILRNVRGYFIEKPTDRFKGKSNMGLSIIKN
jgi:hypothetical protein